MYVNCCDFFYAEDFVRRIGIMLNITPLRSPDIFYNRASRSQKGKILRWNKHAGQQADPVSVHCLQTTEKPRDKMRIHLGCSTTHGRVKLVPHWIPQFHQIFTSSASSKTKTDKKFFCVFVWTWRRAKAKLANNKSSDKNHRSRIVRVSRVHVSFVQLKSHCNSYYMWQLTVNFNWRWQELVNAPSGVNEIQK